jgi:two-component system LytT family response regulator
MTRMMRAYVVDDERLAVDRLTRLLERTGRVQIAGKTTDPEEALSFLNANAGIDVLFLDIQMPGLTGFQMLEKLERQMPVVFTTAYDRYALDAFEVNSVDYLLKPIEADRLERCLDKLERFGGRESASTQSDSWYGSPHAWASARRSSTSRGSRISFSKDKLTFAVMGGREHVVDFTLAELEAKLDPRRFVRIHRAIIVNGAFVQELFPGVDGMLVRLKDDKSTELNVARDRVRELKDRLGI